MANDQSLSKVSLWIRRLKRSVILVLALVIICSWALPLALPWLGNTWGLPFLAQTLQTPYVQAQIQRASWTGVHIQALSLGPDQGLVAQHIHVHWKPWELIQGKIKSIEIIGAQVHLMENNGQWSIAGLPQLLVAREEQKETSFWLPEIQDFFIQGRIFLEAGYLKTSIPMSITGHLEKSALVLAQIHAALAGQDLSARVKAQLKTGDISLESTLSKASLTALAGMLPNIGHVLGGSIDLDTKASLDAHGQPRLDAHLLWSQGSALLGTNYLTLKEPWAVQVQGTQETLAVQLAPLELDYPLSLILRITDLVINLQELKLSCDWFVTLKDLADLKLDPGLELAGSAQLYSAPEGFKAHLQGQVLAMNATIGPWVLDMEPGSLAMDILSNPAGLQLEAQGALGTLNLTQESTILTLAGLRVQTKVIADPEFQGQVRVHGGSLMVRHPEFKVSSSDLEAQADFTLGPEPQVQGLVKTGFSAQSGDFTAQGSLNFPWAWPGLTADPGSVTTKVSWQKKEVAQISTAIVQDVHGYTLEGRVRIPPLALAATLKGQVSPTQFSQSWLEVKAQQTIKLPAQLGQFFPQLSSWSGGADLLAQAQVKMRGALPQVSSRLDIKNLFLSHTESKVELKGGQGHLSFADLSSLRSNPDQGFSFDTLQLGSIILEQGDIHFQVEALHSILVESCKVLWAGGNVGTQALRINPSVDEYLVDLYCDRVNLAQALGQLGMTQAQGGGSVNGRIPVHYSSGSLSFDNGYLYSTPGEKGVLRIEGTQILTAGVPPDSPQYAQLDLAAEALKDYAYDWAKIRMNTVGQDLVVSLELDGKPAHPLPFAFDRQLGGFARVYGSSPGSVFQGIRLDVNFKLPLDQLLQYRQLLELMHKGG